jgi:hypothetical protein
MAGCAELPPIPNPAGLPADALSLQYVLDRGCFPFVLGEKSESSAMKSIGLTKVTSYTLVGSNDSMWIGRFPGVSSVHATSGSCHIHVMGRNTQAYRAVTIDVLRRRVGADPEADGNLARYTAWFPGQVTSCRKGVRYSYYAVSPGGGFSSGYDVDLSLDRACQGPAPTP